MSSSATSSGSSGVLLATFLRRRASAWIVLGVAIGGYLLGFFARPNLSGAMARSSYAGFFTAAAAVVAAIFVAFAVASRDVTSNVQLGITTVLALATSTLGALLDLLPEAHEPLYSIGFVLLIGGGIAGLVSTSLVAAAGLVTARQQRRETAVEALKALDEQQPSERASDAS